MSQSINTTVSFALQALVSGTSSRRLAWSGNVGIAANTGYLSNEVQFPANMTKMSVDYISGPAQGFALVSDGPLNVLVGSSQVDGLQQITLDNGQAISLDNGQLIITDAEDQANSNILFTNSSLVVVNAGVSSVTIQNMGTAVVNARLFVVN